MIYLNENFFTEVKNENYIIHNNKYIQRNKYS